MIHDIKKGSHLFGFEMWVCMSLNPFTPKSDLIDFTLFNARRFHSSKGDLLGVKGLKAQCKNSVTICDLGKYSMLSYHKLSQPAVTC